MATKKTTTTPAKTSTGSRTVSKKAVASNASPAQSASSSSCSKKVEFEFFAPEAKEVAVAGSFNGWRPQQAVLARDKTGRWSVAVPLNPGRYEYRFVVDGRWVNDQRPTEAVSNPFGSINNVLDVRE